MKTTFKAALAGLVTGTAMLSAAFAEEIKVGMLLPYSGVYAALGQDIDDAFALGLETFGTGGLAAAVALGKGQGLWSDPLHSAEVRETVREVAALVDLAACLDASVNAVSYGIRRQLEVGIALATRPKVILMDEPTSGVGPEMSKGFHRLLKALPRDLTILIIEHDMDLAFDVADTITVLNYGEVVFDGLPDAARGSALLKDIYLGAWEDA